MGRGKMKVFHLSDRLRKPFLFCHIKIRLFFGYRCRIHQITLSRKTGNTNQILLICLIEQPQLRSHRIFFQIFIFNDTVVHGIGNPPHAFQITFQVHGCLIQQLLRALRHHAFHTVHKQMIHGNAEHAHGEQRNNGKRKRQSHLHRQRLFLHIF